MNKIVVFVLVLCLVVFAQESADVKPSTLDTASAPAQQTGPEVDLEGTRRGSGKCFRIAGFSLLAGGILSLCVAAIFSAEYNNRPHMGDSTNLDDDLDLEKNENYKTYALISAFTGLGLGAGSVPFIVVGTKRKKKYDAFMNDKMYGLQDRSYFLDVCVQF